MLGFTEAYFLFFIYMKISFCFIEEKIIFATPIIGEMTEWPKVAVC